MTTISAKIANTITPFGAKQRVNALACTNLGDLLKGSDDVLCFVFGNYPGMELGGEASGQFVVGFETTATELEGCYQGLEEVVKTPSLIHNGLIFLTVEKGVIQRADLYDQGEFEAAIGTSCLQTAALHGFDAELAGSLRKVVFKSLGYPDYTDREERSRLRDLLAA